MFAELSNESLWLKWGQICNWDFGSVQVVGFRLGFHWLARSKPGAVLRGLSEGSDLVALKVEGIAWGWFHRAANTSRFWQCMDNESDPLGPNMISWADLNWTNYFLNFHFILKTNFFLYDPPNFQEQCRWNSTNQKTQQLLHY